jgi:hypothetical protein
MAAFPSLRPSERSINIGAPPIREYRALNGAVVRRSFGNQRFAYQLDLVFSNISEKSTSAIWDHYHDNINIRDGFVLPDSIFSGYRTNATIGRNEGLLSRLQALTNIRWFYVEPPQIESIYGSLSTVQVRLSGELRYSV